MNDVTVDSGEWLVRLDVNNPTSDNSSSVRRRFSGAQERNSELDIIHYCVATYSIPAVASNG